eukprot:CAMPEP_0197423008 /NCGR_PEP_ID=MMETSP1170-20131217/18847_1 /TAXON_ID=54406 /ORGANISM="Sarcinochrysis sp, Strain CCMP770" /LENGTH=47 /DNA_ID= /DNA_START= /DNA_END= /DNA_ORIENTATION=
MFVIKKKSAQRSVAEFQRIKQAFMYLGGYFVAIRAIYLVVNRRALLA